MKSAYIITENKSDKELLEIILPKEILNNTIFVTGTGRHAAQSLVKSIFAVKHQPVALVINSETTNESDIRELKDVMQEYLGCASEDIPFRVFIAVPEIENIFFQSKTFVEQLANRKLSVKEWEIVEQNPKKFLHSIVEEQDTISENILKCIDDHTIGTIQKHPLVNNLCEFLSSVITNGD